MKVNITDKAKEQLKKVMEKENALSKAIRIYIAGVGWGGPSFGLALDEQKDNDEVDNTGDIKFLIDNDLVKQYNEFQIDYSDNWLRKGFQVSANGASSSC